METVGEKLTAREMLTQGQRVDLEQRVWHQGEGHDPIAYEALSELYKLPSLTIGEFQVMKTKYSHLGVDVSIVDATKLPTYTNVNTEYDPNMLAILVRTNENGPKDILALSNRGPVELLDGTEGYVIWSVK